MMCFSWEFNLLVSLHLSRFLPTAFCLLPSALPYPRHLLPEELADF